MQTFLPYPNFFASARCLDWRRLGKQRVEVIQIMNCLQGKRSGWQNHPAVRMWEGHATGLAFYGYAICVEWRARGYKDTCLEKMAEYVFTPVSLPPWMGDPKFHAAHRAALVYKDPDWYRQFNWAERPRLEYVWPV